MPRAKEPAAAADEQPPPAGSATGAAYGIAAISAAVIACATFGAVLLWPPNPFGNFGTLVGTYVGAIAGIAIAALLVPVWLIWLLLRSIAATSVVVIAGATVGAIVAWAAYPFDNFGTVVAIYIGALAGIAVAAVLVTAWPIWLLVRSALKS
jgi:hypothetical protein